MELMGTDEGDTVIRSISAICLPVRCCASVTGGQNIQGNQGYQRLVLMEGRLTGAEGMIQ